MKWFLNINDQIQGPFSAEQILTNFKNGSIPYSSHVWAKGQIEWLPITEWEEHYDKLTQAAVGAQAEQIWKIKFSEGRIEERLKMPMALDILKKKSTLKNVLVCPQGESEWIPIYSSHMFMEALNLSRRSYQRAPLLGLAKVTRSESRFSYVVKTAVIGQGGLGVHGLGSNFQVGTNVTIKVESESLTAPLNVQGEIVYSTPQGFSGVSFEKISAEARSIILGYVKKFEASDEVNSGKAT